MSNNGLKRTGGDITLIAIELVRRDEMPLAISKPSTNIIVNLHPIDGTQWVLVKRGNGSSVLSVNSFGVDASQMFLDQNVGLCSDERNQVDSDSYCGAFCLYMKYLVNMSLE